jgi:hypothetical protein
MAEPIYEATVTNNRDFPLIFAGYVLHPQVPQNIKIYKNADFKTYREYVRVNVLSELGVTLNDAGGVSGGTVTTSTGETFVFPFEESDFVSNGSKWKVTVTHNLARVPDINVYDENENILYGDIDHESGTTPNAFTITFSKKVKCTVYIN